MRRRAPSAEDEAEESDDMFDRTGTDHAGPSWSDVEDDHEEDEATATEGSEDESEEDQETFVPLALNVDDLARRIDVRADKITSESEHPAPQSAIPTLCVSKYRLGRPLARGTQAVIFEGCAEGEGGGSCDYVIRLALLYDPVVDPARQQENHIHLQQFTRDVEIRRRLEDCAEDVPFVRLVDAFICDQRFGVEVMPRAAGNLLDLLYRTDVARMANVIEEIYQQSQRLTDRMHQCRILHRDIGFQNLLYSGDTERFQVLITDFETAFYSPPAAVGTQEDRAYEAYVQSDNMSLRKLRDELTEMMRLWQALRSHQAEPAVRVWHRMDAFVKSALEHQYPEVRQQITVLRDQLDL